MTVSPRAYTSAVIVLALLAATGAGLLFYLAGIASAGGDVRTSVPAWSLPLLGVAQFAYAFAIVAVLCARRLNPQVGRRLTRLLNWALLPALPGGTIVGLYGLWAERQASLPIND